MLGVNDGWAVGDAGTILRYQAVNGQWVNMGSPTGARLNSVFLSDSNHGWAVGAGGAILHYDGTIWVNVAGFTSTNLNSVFQVNQEAWAVGDSATILRWTAISWLPVTPSPSLAGNPDLKSIFLVPTGFGLIVGGMAGTGSQATIIRVGQQTVNPIPEWQVPQISLVMILVMTLGMLSRLRKRVLVTHSPN